MREGGEPVATYRIRHKTDERGLFVPFECKGKQAIKEIFKGRISDAVKDEYVIEKQGKFDKWTEIVVQSRQKVKVQP